VGLGGQNCEIAKWSPACSYKPALRDWAPTTSGNEFQLSMSEGEKMVMQAGTTPKYFVSLLV